MKARAEAVKAATRDRHIREQLLPQIAQRVRDPIIAVIRGTLHHRMFDHIDLAQFRLLNVLTYSIIRDTFSQSPWEWLTYALQSDPDRALTSTEMTYIVNLAETLLAGWNENTIDFDSADKLIEPSVILDMIENGPKSEASIQIRDKGFDHILIRTGV